MLASGDVRGGERTRASTHFAVAAEGKCWGRALQVRIASREFIRQYGGKHVELDQPMGVASRPHSREKRRVDARDRADGIVHRRAARDRRETAGRLLAHARVVSRRGAEARRLPVIAAAPLIARAPLLHPCVACVRSENAPNRCARRSALLLICAAHCRDDRARSRQSDARRRARHDDRAPACRASRIRDRRAIGDAAAHVPTSTACVRAARFAPPR